VTGFHHQVVDYCSSNGGENTKRGSSAASAAVRAEEKDVSGHQWQHRAGRIDNHNFA
jgi:hypothetical protein